MENFTQENFDLLDEELMTSGEDTLSGISEMIKNICQEDDEIEPCLDKVREVFTGISLQSKRSVAKHAGLEPVMNPDEMVEALVNVFMNITSFSTGLSRAVRNYDGTDKSRKLVQKLLDTLSASDMTQEQTTQAILEMDEAVDFTKLYHVFTGEIVDSEPDEPDFMAMAQEIAVGLEKMEKEK
jgi:hypothetical protein